MIRIKSIGNFYRVDAIREFDCGNEKLNEYLIKYARQNEDRGLSRTFLILDDWKIVGYYTLSSASLDWNHLVDKDKKSLPKYPIPCIRIARLAIDKQYQNKGFGKMALKEIIKKVLLIRETIGLFALLVEPKESSVSFYKKYGFHKVENDSYILSIQTIVNQLKKDG